MGELSKLLKIPWLVKWQNSFHYIVPPLHLTSYQYSQHNIYTCTLWFLSLECLPSASPLTALFQMSKPPNSNRLPNITHAAAARAISVILFLQGHACGKHGLPREVLDTFS